MTDPESGEVVCSICGLVVQEKMEDTKLQYYEKGMDTRGKEPSSLAHYDMGLSTKDKGYDLLVILRYRT